MYVWYNTLSENIPKVRFLFRMQAWNLFLDQETYIIVQYDSQVSTQNK